LDYLAVYLADHGYDLKKVFALITTSAAYQSRAAAIAVESAPGDYLFTGPLGKRMTAEQFLDAVRATIGVWPQPDARAFRRDGRGQGGQLAAVLAVLDPIAADVQERESPGSDSKDKSRTADSTARAWWAARPLPAALTPLDSLQASLGRPNREQIVSTRPAEFTTLEAITLANGAELADELQRGAVQLLADYQGTADELIDRLFFSALVREPTLAERETARELLGPKLSSAGLEDLLWSLFLLPEFQIIR
jgi:hypothetical protein